MEDYYKILGIEKTANEEDIKKAYRKLAHQYHPDKSGGDSAKFKKLNEAYQILSNQEKRSQYDRFGRVFDGPTGSPFGNGSSGGFGFNFDARGFEDLGGFSDIFDAFFEGMGVKKKKRTYNRGSDIELIQEITLEDSYRGLTKKVSLPTLLKCSECAGVGHAPGSKFINCSACDGQGEVRETRNTFFGSFSQVKACAKCFGSGQVPEKICRACSSMGRVKGNREINVNILSGISDGQIIKVAGAGEAGERGAEAGDLYVRVRVKPHNRFDRKGDDLYTVTEVNLLDVLLGTPIDIKTISGEDIKFTIAPGSSLKEKLKISGEGMPRLGSKSRGDLYLALDVRVPKNLSAKAKKLLDDLRGEV